MENYDLCIVGTGPSSIFALLELVDKSYNKNHRIIVIEKGKNLEERESREVVNGWGGGGTFSDGKLSSSLGIGGVIPGLTSSELQEFEKYILNKLNLFNNYNTLEWDKCSDYDTTPSNLKWLSHNNCHMGTEVTRNIFLNMEHYLFTQPNIDFIFNTEVIDIDYENNLYNVHLDNSKSILTNYLVIATGQKNTLPEKILDKAKIEFTPRAFQLGVRVEDTINNQYKKIIKSNYDFKFVSEYNYDNGVKIRVRTFCCNSGNAHTCQEINAEGFTCFNGHAFKYPDPENHSVNYGIICEIEGLKEYSTKTEQIQLMKKVNNLPTWEDDNFSPSKGLDPKRKLLDGFEHLRGTYPDEVIDALTKFSAELNKIVDLNKAHYLYPEVKLSGNIPKLNYNNFNIPNTNIYMIGDCAISRGIVKASYTGWKFANEFTK